ncbi:hypothetical protein B0A89_12075 [Paracoccus contaminans]|uniref:Superoxide dismutase copper/zinc binding domain-containing protein n=2 Tax=Paracoccus contaminans TaxID=1945662 RepID=A0A1W6CZE2_9RHOB|nr:hypothetical protein B0A89_12075 [Paracoccus contaminans]
MIGALMLGAALALIPLLGHAQSPAGGTAQHAAAAIRDAAGKDAGTATVAATPSGALHVMVDLAGLPPGPHAVHIHETGQCDAPDFKTAGGHLAGGKQHGALSAEGMHTGDLPNIEIDADGKAKAEFFIPATQLAAVTDADGAAFVVHGGADDYVSQPAGKAGDRIACGVFQPAG